MSNLTESEIDKIVKDWQDFAFTKAFAFKGVSQAAYNLFFPSYAKAIITRSNVNVLKDTEQNIIGWLITEPVANSTSTLIHFCYVEPALRNKQVMKDLFSDAGLSENSKCLFTHLTVLSEKLGKKYGFIFSPFNLYKE